MATSIGLRSTGLVVFGGRVASAFTGLLFTVMAARWLTVSQVGTWEVIIDLVTFGSYPIGVVAYWATRDVARGRLVGRTAFAFGALMSGGGLLVYFGFTVVTYSTIAASLIPFLLGALLVPLAYWSAVANSIVQGYRPSVFGYSLLISELAKVAVAYEALYVYRLGIDGVIAALMASYLVQSLVSTYLIRGATAGPLDAGEARNWARLAWLPAISYLPSVVAIADTYAASLAFGASITGYYQIAFIVASVVGYSSALAFSLYPLLLRGGDESLPGITVEFSLLFSIPMASGGIVLSGPILFLFGAKYSPAGLGLSILAVAFVFLTVSGIVDQTLLGTERVDETEKRTFRSLSRSNLIFVPEVNLAAAIVYIIGMLASLSYAFSHGFSISQTVGIWAAVQLVATIVFLVIKSLRARRYARLLPGKSVAYYLVSAAIMSVLVYYVSGSVLDRSLDAIGYGARLLGLLGVGAAVYFGIVYALDRDFRRMAGAFLKRMI